MFDIYVEVQFIKSVFAYEFIYNNVQEKVDLLKLLLGGTAQTEGVYTTRHYMLRLIRPAMINRNLKKKYQYIKRI